MSRRLFGASLLLLATAGAQEPVNYGITVTEQPNSADHFSSVTMKNTSTRPIWNPRLRWTLK